MLLEQIKHSPMADVINVTKRLRTKNSLASIALSLRDPGKAPCKLAASINK